MSFTRLEPVSKATKQSTKYYGAVMVNGEEGKRKCVELFPSRSHGILIERLESRLDIYRNYTNSGITVCDGRTLAC
jgi:hypothetical protein